MEITNTRYMSDYEFGKKYRTGIFKNGVPVGPNYKTKVNNTSIMKNQNGSGKRSNGRHFPRNTNGSGKRSSGKQFPRDMYGRFANVPIVIDIQPNENECIPEEGEITNNTIWLKLSQIFRNKIRYTQRINMK